MQELDDESIDAERSDERHDQSLQEACGGGEVLCARKGPGRCQWGSTDDSACPRAGISDHEANTTTPIDHELHGDRRCTDKEKHDGSALSVCAIIDEGMKEEKMLKTHCLERLMTVDSNMKVEEVHIDGGHEDMDAKLQEAWDDVSGAALDPKEVRRARLKEIQYIKDKNVRRRIPLQEAPTPRVQDREGPLD